MEDLLQSSAPFSRNLPNTRAKLVTASISIARRGTTLRPAEDILRRTSRLGSMPKYSRTRLETTARSQHQVTLCSRLKEPIAAWKIFSQQEIWWHWQATVLIATCLFRRKAIASYRTRRSFQAQPNNIRAVYQVALALSCLQTLPIRIKVLLKQEPNPPKAALYRLKKACSEGCKKMQEKV